MIPCPACAKPVDIQAKHYGTLFLCPLCRGVYFIGWDGTPEKPEVHEKEPEPEPVEEIPVPVEEPVAYDAPVERPQEYVAQEEAPQAWTPPAEEQTYEAPAEPAYETPAERSDETPTEQTDEAPVEQAAEVATEAPAQETTDFSAPMDPFAQAPTETSNDFSDVAAYANSEDAVAGPLSYTVLIRGLELADTFERLREALTDSRFGWDAEQVMSEVRGGMLVIKAMNPTKASILINRVKYLPIEIDWKQEVFGGP